MSNQSSNSTRAIFDLCTHVSPQCPIYATVLGYEPNLGINIFFCIGFGICSIATFIPGIYKRTYAFALAVTSGLVLETAGYIGRILLHDNPWSSQAFELQICAIILAPTLINAGIYFTINNIAKSIGPPGLGRLPPYMYTWIFIPSDVFCLILQAVGGGVAAASDTNHGTNLKELSIGNRLIIAGIALQVVSLLVFGTLVRELFLHARAYHRQEQPGDQFKVVWRDRNFRIFCGSIAGAYCGILIRCIYRIVEMAGGWGNKVMQDQPSFIALEGVMILIPAILLASCPPGILFPQMQYHWRRRQEDLEHESRKEEKEKTERSGPSCSTQ